MLSVPLVRTYVNFVGIPMLPSIYPTLIMDASNQMTFIQRFSHFLVETLLTSLGSYFQIRPINQIMREKFGDDFPCVADLATE
ncbi:hypothetical protein PENTCL1PPCAC_30196, partial [Pristionchus entomophagus]